MSDDDLIRWFAELKDSDPVPNVPDPDAELHRRVARLVVLGLLSEPHPNDLLIDVLHRSRDACRTHLGLPAD